MKKILFVCIGNLCRSPMAEGIANGLFKYPYIFESAGLSREDCAPTFKAISAMNELYGIDISPHRSRNISRLELTSYKWVIALDGFPYSEIRRKCPDATTLLWEIPDPYGSDYDKYIQCAQLIESKLRNMNVLFV